MIERPFAFLFGFSLFIFIGWIFLAPTAQGRLQRSCQPVHWVGNVFVSMAALFGSAEAEPAPAPVTDPNKRDMLRDGPDKAADSSKAGADAVTKTRWTFDEATYSCRYTLWRLVYEEDYKAAMRKMQEEKAAREAAARDAASKLPKTDAAAASRKTEAGTQKVDPKS
jgi:hypothetical protein